MGAKDNCPTCGKLVKNTDEGLRCENVKCDRWFHAKCEGIDTTRYEDLKINGERWFCRLCNIVTERVEIELRLITREVEEAMNARILKMEEKFEVKREEAKAVALGLKRKVEELEAELREVKRERDSDSLSSRMEEREQVIEY